MTKAAQIAEAYVRVAEINHYLVRVDANHLSPEALNNAEQILIAMDNVEPENRIIGLALELLQLDRVMVVG